MKTWIRLAAVTGLLFLPFAAQAESSPEATKWLRGIGNIYDKAPLQVELKGTIGGGSPMSGTIEGQVLVGDKTHQRVNMKMTMGAQGQSMDFTILSVTDGTHTWSEVAMPMGKQVVKMSLEDAEKMAAQGGGLGPGMGSMDPLSLAEQLSETMSFELVGVADGRVTLTAKVDEGNRGQFGNAPVDTIKIVLDEATSMPLEVVVSAGAQPFLEMAFDNLKHLKDSEIPEGSFSYTPPEGVQVMDGAQLLRQAAAGPGGGR